MTVDRHIKPLRLSADELKLTVRLQNNYGRTLCYPVGKTAHAFLEIQGGKTLSDLTLDRAEKLGFEIQTEQPNWRNR